MQEFQPDDLDEAVAFYRSVTDPTARSILDFLIDHPEQRFDARAIMNSLGLVRHSDVARSMYSMGEAAAAVGRKRPWHESQPGYLMRGEISDLLGRARQQAGSQNG